MMNRLIRSLAIAMASLLLIALWPASGYAQALPVAGNGPAPSSLAPSTNRTVSALFYFLNMSGKTRADFKPLTAGQRAKFYAKGLFGPFMFLSAATSAGVTQAMNVPETWGQGAEGYGHRFGNYFAKQAVQRTLRLSGEELLHEDNRYFGSGEHGVGRRIVYALKSSVMARGNDGTQHLSISEIGSIAGSSFISRLWQPSTNNSAGDGAVSFGIGMGVNAGTCLLREFLPDLTHHIFRRSQGTATRTTTP
jgi:hypothetical protein